MFTISHDQFALRQKFTISRGSKTHADVITVHVTRDGRHGWGEAVPYARYGETVESVRTQISALPQDVTQEELQTRLPPGAARNATDCALWDLRAKIAAKPVWEIAGLAPPKPVVTAFTLSLDTPEAMLAQAQKYAKWPMLKIKLGTPDDLPRLRAVRAGAPQARLILDANEGWSPQDYTALLPYLTEIGVDLIEQPFPAQDDDALLHLPRPIPICADESCHDHRSLDALRGKYDFVNIKLDKTGGLTEAIATEKAARDMGFGIMVGCMVGSSLAMAPAVLLAQGASFTDLDGALLLAQDRETPLLYDDQGLHPPQPQLWG